MKMSEKWRAVVGAPDYEVSNLGRVRSLDRVITVTRRVKGRILKPGQTGGSGLYKQVAISINGNKSPKLVHRLVLEAFVRCCPDGYEGAHLDGNPANNCLGNLDWKTQMENDSHKTLHGTRAIGEKHGGSKLCNSDVSRIREARLFGASRKDLASVWGVGLDTISEITSGKTWRHVCQN